MKPAVVLVGVSVLLSVLTSARGESYYDQARRAHDQGKFDEAIHLYTQAVDNDNLDQAGRMFVYCCRGAAWCDKGQYDLAIADYNRAIELDAKYATAYQYRGGAWHSKGAFAKAIADYTRAIELNPKDAYAHECRGNAWSDMGQYAKAIADYTRVIELNPKDAGAFRNRGLAWRAKGDADKAIADFDRVIELDPKFPCTYSDRGNARCIKGAWAKAVADYTHVLKLDPKHDNVHRLRGQTYFGFGKLADAVKDLQRALVLQPDDKYAALMLYCVRSRSKKPADKELNAFASKHIKDHSAWPGALFELLVGRMDAAKCLQAAEPKKPDLTDAKLSDADKTALKAVYEKLRREQLCIAYFYIAQYELIRGRTHEARKLFKKGLATNVMDFFEHIVAKAELKRMGSKG